MNKKRCDDATMSQQGGFTIVELIIALLLGSTIIGVMSVIVLDGLSLNTRATRRTEASSLAFKKIQDYINLSYDNIPIGDDTLGYQVEDFAAEAEDILLANPDAKVYVKPASQLDTSTTTTTTTFSQTVQADSTFISGSEISSIDVDDATNIHWREWRISDDSFNNYTYNRYSPGPDNKPLPSIDLGSSQTVDTIRIEWYSCNYGANNFRIEAKDSSPNSNSGWTTIVSGLNDGGFPCSTYSQDIDVSSNTTPYRHWRMFVVDGTHSLWNVISEFEAFRSGVPGDIVEQQGSDATDSPGALYFSSSDLEMASDGARGNQSIGVIFDDIDTPQASTIDSAFIDFTADESDSGPVTLRITGVDRDNAQPWVGNYAVDNAVDTDSSDGSIGTTATVTWTPGAWTIGESGTSDTRVDITDIVQEIIDRPGWQVDNDMAFAIQYVSGSSKRVAERNPAPSLVLNWSTTETVPVSEYVDADGDGDVDNPTLLDVQVVLSYDAYGQRQTVEFGTYIRKFGIGD